MGFSGSVVCRVSMPRKRGRQPDSIFSKLLIPLSLLISVSRTLRYITIPPSTVKTWPVT
jgi:hypothetical protein